MYHLTVLGGLDSDKENVSHTMCVNVVDKTSETHTAAPITTASKMTTNTPLTHVNKNSTPLECITGFSPGIRWVKTIKSSVVQHFQSNVEHYG